MFYHVFWPSSSNHWYTLRDCRRLYFDKEYCLWRHLHTVLIISIRFVSQKCLSLQLVTSYQLFLSILKSSHHSFVVDSVVSMVNGRWQSGDWVVKPSVSSFARVMTIVDTLSSSRRCSGLLERWRHRVERLPSLSSLQRMVSVPRQHGTVHQIHQTLTFHTLGLSSEFFFFLCTSSAQIIASYGGVFIGDQFVNVLHLSWLWI